MNLADGPARASADEALQRRIEAVWRIESAKIIGAIARMVRDVGLAEDLAQEALVAALEHWPRGGVPQNPGAWLMATARNRALDGLRQRTLHVRKQAELGADADARGDHVVPDFSDSLDAARDDFGDDLLRLIFAACHPVLAREAQLALTLRLGRVLAALAPAEAEVHGLVALMEIRASRLRARTDAQGRPILLPDQDRGRWDRPLIGRGMTALARAGALAAGQEGPYALQAAIAACHAQARTAADTDWAQIVALYDRLLERLPSPVVQLNRAVALSMAAGAAAALPAVEALAAVPQMQRYHLLHAVHGDLLVKLGRGRAARLAFERAAELTVNERERAMLVERARAAEAMALR